MKIKVNLTVGGKTVKEDVIEIDDYKLEELTEDEIEGSIEIQVRSWVDREIQVTWETDNT